MATWTKRLLPGILVPACALALAPVARAADPASDPRAVALAEKVLQDMGGRAAWDDTHYLRWHFFAGRLLTWDKWTGDVRIEAPDGRLVLMNVNTRTGRAWKDDREITQPDSLEAALEWGFAAFINDSYWLIMPYKMLDPGTVLHWGGEDTLPDGRAADRITITFDEGTGLTPRNKYDVWVARDTGLVAQWSYYRDASDPEPEFTLPWSEWKRFGNILLATVRGKNWDWEIAASDSMPPSLFESP